MLWKSQTQIAIEEMAKKVDDIILRLSNTIDVLIAIDGQIQEMSVDQERLLEAARAQFAAEQEAVNLRRRVETLEADLYRIQEREADLINKVVLQAGLRPLREREENVNGSAGDPIVPARAPKSLQIRRQEALQRDMEALEQLKSDKINGS